MTARAWKWQSKHQSVLRAETAPGAQGRNFQFSSTLTRIVKKG
jgi:hypothetical protein